MAAIAAIFGTSLVHNSRNEEMNLLLSDNLEALSVPEGKHGHAEYCYNSAKANQSGTLYGSPTYICSTAHGYGGMAETEQECLKYAAPSCTSKQKLYPDTSTKRKQGWCWIDDPKPKKK